jgi:hypothetical protein
MGAVRNAVGIENVVVPGVINLETPGELSIEAPPETGGGNGTAVDCPPDARRLTLGRE